MTRLDMPTFDIYYSLIKTNEEIKMKEFVDYVMEFYGEYGIYDIKATREEVWSATCIRLKRTIGQPLNGISFEGDSLDREAVRDIILEMRG
jgi:hypothetical protein